MFVVGASVSSFPFDIGAARFLLSLLRSLGLASHDLDLVGVKLLCVVVEFEIDVLDDECPDLVAEPIHVKMALFLHVSQNAHLPSSPASHMPGHPHLESHARLHLVTKHGSNVLVEVGHDAHRQLRLDATTTNEIVECIRECDTDATIAQSVTNHGRHQRQHAYEVPL